MVTTLTATSVLPSEARQVKTKKKKINSTVKSNTNEAFTVFFYEFLAINVSKVDITEGQNAKHYQRVA